MAAAVHDSDIAAAVRVAIVDKINTQLTYDTISDISYLLLPTDFVQSLLVSRLYPDLQAVHYDHRSIIYYYCTIYRVRYNNNRLCFAPT